MDPNAALYDLALLMYERPGLIVAAALLIPLLIGVIIDRTGKRPTGVIERAGAEPPPPEPVVAEPEEAAAPAAPREPVEAAPAPEPSPAPESVAEPSPEPAPVREPEPVADVEDPTAGLHQIECEHTLGLAFERLDDGCRDLISALYYEDPAPSYQEISERLGRPVGSLGPTRNRCLKKLRKLYDQVGGPEF